MSAKSFIICFSGVCFAKNALLKIKTKSKDLTSTSYDGTC